MRHAGKRPDAADNGQEIERCVTTAEVRPKTISDLSSDLAERMDVGQATSVPTIPRT